MVKTIGYAARSANEKLAQFEFERRDPGEKDVVIDIMYCGICHSDIHEARSEWRSVTYPIVPGHEIVGRISHVGSAVKKFNVGDAVGVGCMVDSCGECSSCKAGAEYYCMEGGPVWTYGSVDRYNGNGQTYGGYSDKIVVNQDFVLKMPDGTDLAASAPLLCAGTTTYTPLMYWKAGPGQRVGVLGLGGLGHIAVKIAKSLGAEVVVLTTSRNKAEDAKRLGADSVVITTDKAQLKEHAGSFDLILDTVSAKHEFDEYLALLKLNGKLVLVGLPSVPLQVSPFSIVTGHRILAGSGLGGIRETQEMLDYCVKHGIKSDIELIPIQKVNEAYDRVVKGDVRYRFVIDMASLKK